MTMQWLDALRPHLLALPSMAKFAIVIAIIVGVPALARRLRVPEHIGLLAFGVLLRPHVLGVAGTDHPIAQFFADLGKLMLMFTAGLEPILSLCLASLWWPAFLAGLSVNAAVGTHPAKEKLEFFGKAPFVPIFFVVTGFLIAPVEFAEAVVDNFWLVAGIVASLIVGKGVAAFLVGQAFGYARPAKLEMWALTLPQVAATLAAASCPSNAQ